MSAASSQREPPKVPNHELIRPIGRGSYGEIWMARSELGVMRAVKVVDRRTFETETAFQREFDGMARFEPISREHAGFVDILHVGRSEADEFFYYVMELADDHIHGQRADPQKYVPKTLRTELGRRGRLLAEEVVALGLSLSESLAALHREGLVHRDIKLANVIFVGGHPKIADIGLVAASGQASFVGTEGYVPPEGPGTAQGDIYSLGKVLYELAMGKDRLDFPALNTRIDDLPDKDDLLRLNDVFLRACANDPTERYVRAEQMHEDLGRIRDGRPLRQLGRRVWPWMLAAAVAVAAAVPTGNYYLNRPREVIATPTPAPPVKIAYGTITIETEPSDAMVVIEGRMKRSPAIFDQLPAGAHSARIMQPGFEPVEQSIQVEADRDVTLPKFALVRSVGRAQCESRPPGASYELKDSTGVIRSGKLPAAIEGLAVGAYTLLAKFDGRERSVPLEIKKDELASVAVEFPFGEVTVESDPKGAQIVVDSKPAGKAPLKLSLADGAHDIVARYPRWPEQQRKLEVDPAKPQQVKFEFAPGSVKITSAPGGATVLAGGKELGRTPLLLEDLAPGKVEYELRLAGFEPLPLSGMVKPGEQTFLGDKFVRSLIGPKRGQPWQNGLGMKFIPLNGDTAPGGILMSIWPTRVKDFAAFCAAANHPKPTPDFAQDENHPVVLVNYEDARAFCDWLTQKEQAANQLAEGQFYRLPSDAEWSRAAGLPDEGRNTPEERDGKIREYAWGKHWPPPAGAGNFADSSLRRSGQTVIGNYHDGFPQTSPVGSFAANSRGLFDVCGNVWQWVLDPYNASGRWHVLRGGSWATDKPAELSLSYRNVVDPDAREVIYGFRCVLVTDPGN